MSEQCTRALPSYLTWERNSVLAHTIHKLNVRDRRYIFASLRSVDVSDQHRVFFPQYGFTLTEFAVWHVIGER